jgi:hypothetical protein
MRSVLDSFLAINSYRRWVRNVLIAAAELLAHRPNRLQHFFFCFRHKDRQITTAEKLAFKQVSSSLLLMLVVVGIKSCSTFSHVLDLYLYLCKGSVLFKLIESCWGVLISWVHHHVSSLCYTGAAVVVLVCLDSKLLDRQCLACPLELRDPYTVMKTSSSSSSGSLTSLILVLAFVVLQTGSAAGQGVGNILTSSLFTSFFPTRIRFTLTLPSSRQQMHTHLSEPREARLNNCKK